MIPAKFDYVRAGSADEAVSLLGQHGDEAKLLAGGHSLLPLMKLRLAAPSVLVDIGRLTDLSYIRDGGDHAFLLDPKTRGEHQRRGIGTRLVSLAAEHAKAAGCEWLHVDFEPELGPFYLEACGFPPTPAGLIHLRSVS